MKLKENEFSRKIRLYFRHDTTKLIISKTFTLRQAINGIAKEQMDLLFNKHTIIAECLSANVDDKNDIEIFEGDIVEWNDYREDVIVNIKEEVIFKGGAFYPVCLMDSSEFKVIGSVHYDEKHESTN